MGLGPPVCRNCYDFMQLTDQKWHCIHCKPEEVKKSNLFCLRDFEVCIMDVRWGHEEMKRREEFRKGRN